MSVPLKIGWNITLNANRKCHEFYIVFSYSCTCYLFLIRQLRYFNFWPHEVCNVSRDTHLICYASACSNIPGSLRKQWRNLHKVLSKFLYAQTQQKVGLTFKMQIPSQFRTFNNLGQHSCIRSSTLHFSPIFSLFLNFLCSHSEQQNQKSLSWTGTWQRGLALCFLKSLYKNHNVLSY